MKVRRRRSARGRGGLGGLRPLMHDPKRLAPKGAADCRRGASPPHPKGTQRIKVFGLISGLVGTSRKQHEKPLKISENGSPNRYKINEKSRLRARSVPEGAKEPSRRLPKKEGESPGRVLEVSWATFWRKIPDF